MRHLRVVVGVPAGDREADAAAAPEGPGRRDHGETQLLRLVLRHRLRVGAREGVERPAPALLCLGCGFLAVERAQNAFACGDESLVLLPPHALSSNGTTPMQSVTT